MSLQETLAARAKAQAAANAAPIQTGVQASIEKPAETPVIIPEITAKDAVEGFDTTDMAEGTYFLLNVPRLLMPGGVYMKPDDKGCIVAETEAQAKRLDYFAKSGLCVKLK